MIMKEIIVENEQETIELGYRLGELLTKNSIITIDGDLGAGKTTFTKGIGKGIGVEKIINSPTFTILKEYQGKYKLSHFDVYRLENQDDDLGFEEIFESDDVCVIEWAKFIENILPNERLDIFIKKLDDNRRCFVFKPRGEKYEYISEEISK